METKNHPEPDTLLKFFEVMHARIVQGSLKSAADPDLMGKIQRVSHQLNLSANELLILGFVCHHQATCERLTTNDLKKLLSGYMDAFAFGEVISLFLKLEVLDPDILAARAELKLKTGVMHVVKSGWGKMLSQLKPVGTQNMLDYFRRRLLDFDPLNIMEVQEEIDFLKELNPQEPLVKKFLEYASVLEAYVMLAICARHLFEESHFDVSYAGTFVNFGHGNLKFLRKSIVSGNWLPVNCGWAELAGNDIADEDLSLILTEKGAEELLHGAGQQLSATAADQALKLPPYATAPEKIGKVKLLFPEKMQSRVKELEMLFSEKTFRQYRESLPEGQRLRGITVLLHGDPGTGKTELAMQLARQTKRPLFQVNVSQVMSKWVGESEKNLKTIFREYKKHLHGRSPEPILFLNECDSMLGQRLAATDSVSQMRNGLSNLLLDEMENFRGLLIATTNMTRNLDPAFERRFLYKMEFQMPDTGLRARLWKQFIPELKKPQAELLGEKFPFSPGEMQNVAGRLAVTRLLKSSSSLFETVLKLCSEEKWNVQAKGELGFR